MGQKHTTNLHRGIHAVHFSLTAGLALVSVALLAVYMFAPAILVRAGSGNTQFVSGSAWNTALPKYPQLAANSATLAQDVVSQTVAYGATADISTKGAPVYIADSSTTTVSVIPWGCAGPADTSLAAQWSAVPIPFYAQPSGGASNRMVVYQPSTGTIWEFSQMYKTSGQWFACHGGQIADATVNSGVFSGSYGVTASGLALLGGQVSVADVQRGRIDHAIGLTLPQVGAAFGWPAIRGGGGGTVPMGTRLQLDPTIDVSALGLSAYGQMVARTAQTYGFIVWDTGTTVSIEGENPTSYTTHGALSPYNGVSLAGFPWNKLRALPLNYGISNHLPQITSFGVSATKVAQHATVDLSWQATNISECSIPGVTSHVGPSGTFTTPPMEASTSFTLACSGPNGSVSRSVAVTVPANDPDLPPVPPQAMNLTVPVNGSANIISELFDQDTLNKVYKVAYYERGSLLQVTTAAPYALTTDKIADGQHALEARIFYRDGHEDKQNVSVRILNHPASLLAVHPPSIPKQNTTPALALGMLGCFGVMMYAARIGWHKAHL